MDDKGRLIFQGYCTGQPWCKFARKSKNDDAPWDVSYSGISDEVIIGEIKVREYNANDFPDWMLEVKKIKRLRVVYDKMMKYDPSQNVKIHYINIFKDNELMIWDITNIVYTSIIEELPATTCGNQNKKNKEVTYLPTHQAIINTKINKNGYNI
jgi:hypothetical protein